MYRFSKITYINSATNRTAIILILCINTCINTQLGKFCRRYLLSILISPDMVKLLMKFIKHQLQHEGEMRFFLVLMLYWMRSRYLYEFLSFDGYCMIVASVKIEITTTWTFLNVVWTKPCNLYC